MNFILIFFSGFTLAVAGINLFIGISNKNDRSYLYFGLLSLFASLFLLIQMTTLDLLSADLTDYISITLACSFYGLFLWFIGEYTDYVKRKIRVVILSFILITYITYIFTKALFIPWSVWESIAHMTIASISIYGIIAGLKRKNSKYGTWSYLFVLLMFLLLISAIIYGLSAVFAYPLDLNLQGNVSPLDFFPVLFSIIIGSKMSHDILQSTQLEDEVRQKEKEWGALLDSINLLIVKLDQQGIVLSVNSFLQSFTGYNESELVGKNWIDRIASDVDKKSLNSAFDSLISGKEQPVYKNAIKVKNGELRNIQWSNLSLKDSIGKVTGVLSIGADVTERESALAEIQQLKDQLEKENLLLKAEVKKNDYSSEIIGESDALKYVIKRTQQVANTNSSVLLEGETGVGKELFADMIHQNSLRIHKPFIKVNCASLPKELIESELFGHEKGSFTGAIKTRQGRFELADKGTLFLDEIGELPLDLQPKLLRVLQSGEFERIGSEQTKKVDVRVIAATNRNLQEESEKGSFRQDLFFRLNVYPITIPPLRQRIEDIPVLIKHFTSKIGKKIGRKIKHISKADIKKLQSYDWPGNIRELENVLERAIINSEGDTIKLDESQLKPIYSHQNSNNGQIDEFATFSDSQINHIMNVLNECNWRINGESGAAKKLGMPPSTLRSKMKKLKIERPKTQ